MPLVLISSHRQSDSHSSNHEKARCSPSGHLAATSLAYAPFPVPISKILAIEGIGVRKRGFDSSESRTTCIACTSSIVSIRLGGALVRETHER